MPKASPIYFQESCAFPLGPHELDKISAVQAMMAIPWDLLKPVSIKLKERYERETI